MTITPPTGWSARRDAAPASLPAEVYRQLGELCPTLALDIAPTGRPVRPGWIDGATLRRQPDALDALLEAEALRIQDRYGLRARPDVVATKTLHAHLWAVCLLMSGPWFLQGRVPRIRPADVRIEPAGGRLEIAPPERFACLPSDPACAQPGVRVLPHEQALRAELRDAVADHVRTLLPVLGPRTRRGPHALWGMVGDDLISGIWHLGRALGTEADAVRTAAELLPSPQPPFPAGADFHQFTDAAGRLQTTRTRLGCCLHYTICPTEPCATCPRLRPRSAGQSVAR